MEFSKELRKQIEEEEIYREVFTFTGAVEPVREWTKWLNYIPLFEVLKLDLIGKKKVDELTESDYEFIAKVKENALFARLFGNFFTRKNTVDEQRLAIGYVKSKSIEKFMESKLTEEEKQYAETEIKRLMNLDLHELFEKIRRDQDKENYVNLSMIDAYILHKIGHLADERAFSQSYVESSNAIFGTPTCKSLNYDSHYNPLRQ